MATPSSSSTTPSPQLRYSQPGASGSSATTVSNGMTPSDRDERERAVQKFLARAEISKLTRGLRTRLSYATFKAMHNLSHNSLPDLEAQAPDDAPHARSTTLRANNYYNNPATQGNSAMTPNTPSRGATRKGSMAPPPPVTASAAQSLFSSILAPPPAKRARTIHNPNDPPVPAPLKGKTPSPAPRRSTKSSRATDAPQTKSKSRRGAKDKEGRAEEKGKGRQPAVSHSEENAVEMDMKAAATLTSLLLQSRPSISAGASSPRSSISAGSDTGSTQSYSHFAQSSTRTVTAATTAELSYSRPVARPSTPPPSSSADNTRRHGLPQPSSMRVEGNTTPTTQGGPIDHGGDSGTPHPPSDTEAADLMLYLATSPSPVRPSTTRDRASKDPGAFRALGSSGLKGRVLFPTHGGSEGGGPRPLRRDDTSSFTSTTTVASDFAPTDISVLSQHSIATDVSPSPSPQPGLDGGGHLAVPMEPTVTPPTPTDPAPSQLLPSPPSPIRSSPRATSTERAIPSSASGSGSLSTDGKKLPNAPLTPGGVPFNLSDFINVSPSPAAAVGPPSRLGSSLHADIGRRLFEEHHGVNGAGTRGENAPARRSGLGAGIDLVKS
ncbi:hypothetical protein B0H21DRAFT_44210 [Amylocystis lapponica]|nr:hypothetical protein B0H21DRAFT_44210 [Amylocystis lapponica]